LRQTPLLDLGPANLEKGGSQRPEDLSENVSSLTPVPSPSERGDIICNNYSEKSLSEGEGFRVRE